MQVPLFNNNKNKYSNYKSGSLTDLLKKCKSIPENILKQITIQVNFSLLLLLYYFFLYKC